MHRKRSLQARRRAEDRRRRKIHLSGINEFTKKYNFYNIIGSLLSFIVKVDKNVFRKHFADVKRLFYNC